jgi:hypothetical protein
MLIVAASFLFYFMRVATCAFLWHHLLEVVTWDTSNYTIHLPFSITYGTSTPRCLLALLRCLVHHGQVLVNPSLTTIKSHISLHVFHRLILETILLVCWIRSSIIVFLI